MMFNLNIILKNIRLSFLYFAMVLSLSSVAQTRSYLESEALFFVDEIAKQKNIGIEIEFKGLSDSQIIKIIQHFYPEAIQVASSDGDIVFKLPELFLGKNKEIRIKIEGEAYKYQNDPEAYERQKAIDVLVAPREIVFPPLVYDELIRVDQLIKTLEKNGAEGTNKGHGVSIQVNVEHEPLDNPKAIEKLLNLMRNYYNKQNQKQAQALINPASFRSEYILNPQAGFMKKLADPNYRPTARQLFDDFLYRQSLEFKGHTDAWTMPIEEARRILLSYPGEDAVVPEVVKMNKIRISSLLMYMFPNDPLSLKYIQYNWAKPVNLIELREFNNDFRLLEKVRWALGAIRAAERFGHYVHDLIFERLKKTCKGVLLY